MGKALDAEERLHVCFTINASIISVKHFTCDLFHFRYLFKMRCNSLKCVIIFVVRKQVLCHYFNELSFFVVYKGIDIYFTPPNITVPNVSIDTEISDWNKIKDSHNPNDFQNFLNHYPFGLFSNPAKAILAQLNNSNTNITSPQNNTRNDQELMSKGIWRDVKTNLTWMRCSVGQRWNGETCKGTPDKYKWELCTRQIS